MPFVIDYFTLETTKRPNDATPTTSYFVRYRIRNTDKPEAGYYGEKKLDVNETDSLSDILANVETTIKNSEGIS